MKFLQVKKLPKPTFEWIFLFSKNVTPVLAPNSAPNFATDQIQTGLASGPIIPSAILRVDQSPGAF